MNGDISPETLTRESLIQAAAGLPEGDSTRVETVIDGRRYEALPLVARALQISTDDISVASAMQILERLKLPLEGGLLPSSARAPARDAPVMPIERDEELPTPVTAELARELRRQQGRWVAISNGLLLGASTDLKALLAETDRAQATYLFVGKDSNADREDLG